MQLTKRAGQGAHRTKPRGAGEHRLPSGRSVVLKATAGGEEIEVRTPDGTVEVRIDLTDAGAVVSLRGGRLELQAADAVVVNSKRFEVHTTEGADLHSDGDLRMTGRELRVKTAGDMHMNGGIIHLNC